MTVPDPSIDPKVRAFLDLIAWSEGTSCMGDNGYNVIVESTIAHPILFTSYADHPRIRISIERLHIYSTAAGRYQFIARTWDALAAQLGLKDFSPPNQDKACVKTLSNRHALILIETGDIEKAIYACNEEWASFPGSPYEQGEQKMPRLLAHYTTFLKGYLA
jgi:lysozyme